VNPEPSRDVLRLYGLVGPDAVPSAPVVSVPDGRGRRRSAGTGDDSVLGGTPLRQLERLDGPRGWSSTPTVDLVPVEPAAAVFVVPRWSARPACKHSHTPASISRRRRTCATRCITANVLQTKQVDARRDKLETELS